VELKLYVQWSDAGPGQQKLRQTLLDIPGVRSVGQIGMEQSSVEGHVTLDYNPAVTNPIMIEDALRQGGVAVMSASSNH
jgi:hypothetical protein